jgi:hypothetical protein
MNWASWYAYVCMNWDAYPETPASLYTPLSTDIILRFSPDSANMIRVLATSRGVVTAAAIPPGNKRI